MKKLVAFIIFALISVWVWQEYGYLLTSYSNLPKNTEVDPTKLIYDPVLESDTELSYLDLPSGFQITYFAQDVPGARSLAIGEGGTVYVGTRSQGVVYALIDSDQDGRAEERHVLGTGLNSPNGLVYHNGDLYVAEIHRLLKYPNINQTYDSPGEPLVIYDQLPRDPHHGWRYLALGPDEKLYIGIGAPCNVCENKDPFASIARLNLDGSGFEVIARGIRNTVGFAWNPLDGSLWFTDNGRDLMGDDLPGDELNRLSLIGSHFGFPYCHEGSTLDPAFGRGQTCQAYVAPTTVLGPHVAALGMTFYTGTMFPAEYRHKIIIAEHGSWNRKIPIGYRLTTVDLSGQTTSNYQPFVSGWLGVDYQVTGRPVDLKELPDGSLLISDDFAGSVYRLTYTQ